MTFANRLSSSGAGIGTPSRRASPNLSSKTSSVQQSSVAARYVLLIIVNERLCTDFAV
jgi:hypothetical protein